MLGLRFAKPTNEPLEVLLLGAHCDDIEIGCGGTILGLVAQFPRLKVRWIVLSSDTERGKEANDCATKFLSGASHATIEVERFRDGYLPYEGGQVKDFFEELKTRVAPDVIFTHYRDDWHQDHRIVCELTWNTWRNHLILEYEIPKYDPDVGSPNFFTHLSEKTAKNKVEYILNSYPTQASRQWFTRDTMYGLMRLRGIECGAPRFAEAFYCRKALLAKP